MSFAVSMARRRGDLFKLCRAFKRICPAFMKFMKNTGSDMSLKTVGGAKLYVILSDKLSNAKRLDNITILTAWNIREN